jgi:hypothetical protein
MDSLKAWKADDETVLTLRRLNESDTQRLIAFVRACPFPRVTSVSDKVTMIQGWTVPCGYAGLIRSRECISSS